MMSFKMPIWSGTLRKKYTRAKEEAAQQIWKSSSSSLAQINAYKIFVRVTIFKMFISKLNKHCDVNYDLDYKHWKIRSCIYISLNIEP